MRQIGKIPRILSVKKINGLLIHVIFKNGEERIIDFNQVLNKLKINTLSPITRLRKPEEFKKVRLVNHTLSWDNIDQYVVFNGKKIKIPFEIGADVLYSLSTPVPKTGGIGQMMKEARTKAGLSQEVLAARSGTTRSYISKIENNQSGIEVDTLKRIVETGLGATLDISIRPGKNTRSTQGTTNNESRSLYGAINNLSGIRNPKNDVIRHSVKQFTVGREVHSIGGKKKLKKSKG